MVHVHGDVEIGVATHTGRVRTTNEDDYLVVAPEAAETVRRDGRLFAVADGMGGVSGGAEASRAAVRALGHVFTTRPGEASDVRLRAGFEEACRRVFRLSRESPRLAEMGTTLTALELRADSAVIGHIGDTRCVRVRRGRAEQLTRDHAMAEPRNLLTRCIGAGQESEEPDIVSVDVEAGDVFALMTDGVWNVVPEAELAALVKGDLRVAAERVVLRCWERGAADNCTIVLVRVRSTAGPGAEAIPLELPSGEVVIDEVPAARGSLTPPRWPWLVLALAACLGVLVWARVAQGMDVVDWLWSR